MSRIAGAVRATIDAGLAGGNVVVFPSQVAADFWRSDTLRRLGAAGMPAVVRSDRFISWDTFKELTSTRRTDRAPANGALRRLAARRLTLDNCRNPFLQRIVPREFAADSLLFADHIAGGLTGLQALLDRAEFLDPDLSEDVRALHARYSAMLDSGGYFEPAWAPAGVVPAGRRFTIFFPSLIEDFGEFEPQLRSLAEIDTVPLPEGLDEHEVRVREYDDALIELRDVFDAVERLLLDGVPAARIAVSIGDLDAWRDEVEREARRRELPIGMRAGMPLSDHAAGQIFARIADCVDSAFHPDSVKRLVHHIGIPWCDGGRMRLLARFGVAHGCLGGSGGRPAAAWYEAFSAGGSADFRARAEAAGTTVGELANLFRAFEEALRAIVHASGFGELRSAIYAFLGRFVDTGAWGEEIEPVFQRCTLALAEWRTTSERSGLSADAPFALFRAALAEKIYVRPADRTGVAVYPYRVAAGIAPEHHFVVGASRDAITIPTARLPFVREDELERIEEAEGASRPGGGAVDPTVAFFRAYTESGETVRISYGRRSTAGAQVAPPGRLERDEPAATRFEQEAAFFAGAAAVAGGADIAAGEGSPAGRRSAAGVDPSLTADPSPPRSPSAAAPRPVLYRTQLAGYRANLARRRPDYRREPIPAELGAQLRARMVDDGRMTLSPARVEAMAGGPFSLLLNRVLRVEDEQWQLLTADPLSEGTLLHDLARRIDTHLARADTPYGEADEEEIAGLIEARLDDYLRHGAVVDSPVPAAVLRMQRAAFAADARALFSRLAELFPACRPYRQEWNVTRALGDTAIVGGRIDSAVRCGERIIIIDYKRGNSSIPTDDDVRSLVKPQLPLYVFMAESELEAESERGVQIESAAYIAARNGGRISIAVGERPEHISRRSSVAIPTEEWDDYRDLVAAELDRVAARLLESDYRCPNPWLGCDGCSTRAVCRAKYGHREVT